MSGKVTIDPQKFLELEYQQAKAEILKRIELRQQIIQITLTFSGILIGAGVQTKNMLISSIYPPLAFCFVMLWAQNDIRGRQLGQYIREQIEVGMSRWETFYKEELAVKTMLGKYPLSIFGPGGAFIISQLIAIIFPIFYATNNSRERWILITIDIFALLGTIVLFHKVLRNRERTLQLKMDRTAQK